MRQTLKSNLDIQITLKLLKFLMERNFKGSLPAELTADVCVPVKFAPITSIDVEQTFPSYKNVLSENQSKFLFKNL